MYYWAEAAKQEYQDALLALLNPIKDNQDEIHNIFENLQKDTDRLWLMI